MSAQTLGPLMWRTLAVLWLALGIGLVADSIVSAIDLLNSEWARKLNIWVSILMGTAAGVGAVVLGAKLSSRALWVRVLAYVLCVLFILYTLFILGITPDRALVRPLLLVQIFVLALCAWTVVSLFRAQVLEAQTSNPPVNADARDVPAHASDRAARAGYRER